MTPRKLLVNQARLWDSLMIMGAVGGTQAGGCNRQALTDLDRQGRDLFVGWARDLGCTIIVDAIGNIFARREGRDPGASAVLAGSHLDTQATGGKFDGVYGVLAGLEVMRTLVELEIETVRPIEIACWTNEEGCRFAPAMLGSGVIAGIYDLDFAYSREDKAGVRLDVALEMIGYRGDAPAKPRSYAAMFEAHIEQGPILEKSGSTIGVVTGIQGAVQFDITLTGASAHAGPTPMTMRRDPWKAAIPTISGALALAEANPPWARATIGDLVASPGARNTVPERLTFSVDVRHPDQSQLDRMVADLLSLVQRHADENDIGVAIEKVWAMPPTSFDPTLIATVAAAAERLGLRHERIVSGAGHDSLHTASFAPTTMIFVPCEGGVSHNEAESAQPDDLAAGANVLLHAMLEVAGIVDRADDLL